MSEKYMIVYDTKFVLLLKYFHPPVYMLSVFDNFYQFATTKTWLVHVLAIKF